MRKPPLFQSFLSSIRSPKVGESFSSPILFGALYSSSWLSLGRSGPPGSRRLAAGSMDLSGAPSRRAASRASA